jgi:Flp pilus assembly protein TadB
MKILIVLLMSAAAWLSIRPSSRHRLQVVVPDQKVAIAAQFPMRMLSSIVLGVGIALVLGSMLGVALGILAALAAHWFVGRLESRADRERRSALVSQVPIVCDLLSATLASGASLRSALVAVAFAVGAPASESLLRVDAAVRMGASQHTAWITAKVDPEFSRIAAAFQRSASSGAPIADVFIGIGDDERRRKRRTVEVAARSAGVRSVAPLAACYLPAFILLGIVPVVASMATDVFST